MTKNFYYSYFPEAIIKSFTALAIILCINTTSIATDDSKKIDTGLSAHISSDLKSIENDTKKDKKDKEEDQDAPEEKTQITENELQNIVKNLPAKDKTVINAIQKQISGWPKDIFSEIRDYNEFVAVVSQQAKAKYNQLSPEAKEALEVEKGLRKELSKEALEVLANLHINNAY